MTDENFDKKFHSGRNPGEFHINMQVGDKYEIVKRYISGKNVLDIGCTGGDPEAYSKDLWMHGYIKRNSNSVTGVDLNKNEVNRLNKLGYDIAYGNAENINLNKKFDIIFAGDLIEHLYNPGLFLENVKRHMGHDSRLILVTPNPHRYGRIKDSLIKGYIRNHADHTCWFDPVTLSQLLGFHDFEVETIFWTGYTKRMSKFLGHGIINLLPFKGVLAEDFIVVAKIKIKPFTEKQMGV